LIRTVVRRRRCDDHVAVVIVIPMIIWIIIAHTVIVVDLRAFVPVGFTAAAKAQNDP
jgi:hypothetical protein